jgi:hypothetical protein
MTDNIHRACWKQIKTPPYTRTGFLFGKKNLPQTASGGRPDKIKPHPFGQHKLPVPETGSYLLLRLDAFSGLIFVLVLLDSTAKWVARLQLPFFHLMEGSGQALQYHPEESSVPRLQPLHCSTIWLQIPPL